MIPDVIGLLENLKKNLNNKLLVIYIAVIAGVIAAGNTSAAIFCHPEKAGI